MYEKYSTVFLKSIIRVIDGILYMENCKVNGIAGVLVINR